MKKLMIFLGLLGCVACSDDKTEEAPAGPLSPLEVTLNSTSLCRGETLTATVRIADTEEGDALRKSDFTLYFEAIDEGLHCELFTEFPYEVAFPVDRESVTVDFPIKESDFTGEHTVTLWVSAEGRAIEGAAQTVTISDYHYVTVAVKDADSNDVTEGDSFVLQATIDAPAASDLHITLTPDETAAGDAFENLPSTLTIPAGETSAQSGEVTVAWDNGETQEDRDWTFTGAVDNDKYAVRDFTLTRIDSDLAKGDRLLDERWVYDYPERTFYSSATEALYLACPSYREGDVLMTKSTEYGKGSKHPNRTLADKWTLLNAVEFQALDGWSYSRTARNNYGVRPALTANGWGAQNTAAIEGTCYVNNEKFTDVTDDGYLRMWAAKDPGQASTGSGDKTRTFGAAALYANKIGTNTTVPQHTVITVGTRIEIRARIRGALQGFNYAIWLMGNSNNSTTDWPDCGEIDIMENPVMTSNVAGTIKTVHQTLHYGTPVDDVHANPTVSQTIEPSEWNIYWVEIVDDNTINMGINGTTTRTFTSSDNSFKWAFNREMNPNGLHILLTTGLAAEWSCGELTLDEINSGSWADPQFTALSYEESKSSDLTPRMEVDWIRYWINENYTTAGAGNVNTAGKFF